MAKRSHWLVWLVGVSMISSVLVSLPAALRMQTATAVGGYDNAAIADTALRYVGRWGAAACVDAGRSGATGGAPLGDGNNADGECKAFVNCIVWMASGHTQWPAGGYSSAFLAAGAQEVSLDAATKGDIIQWEPVGNNLHTAIVVENRGGGIFRVVDSNWGYTRRVNDHVMNVHMSGFAAPRFFRLGTVNAGLPFGYLDEASSPAPGVLRVTGWAADPDAPTTPIDVHVYANSTGFNLGPADDTREDVGSALPGFGSNHGFAADLTLESGGSYRVCAYGINVPSGDNPALKDCKQVAVADPRPFGHLDTVTSPSPGKITVSGWAADPNQPTSPIDVHIYVGQTGFNIGKAAGRRDDVAQALPGYGPNHGYTATLNVPGGSHQVCAFGINVGPGSNQPLKDCKKITVAAPPPASPRPSPPPVSPRPSPPPVSPRPSPPPVSPRPSPPPHTKGVGRLSVRVKPLKRNRLRVNWPNVAGSTHYKVHFKQRATPPITRSSARSRMTIRIRRGSPCVITVRAMQGTKVLAKRTLKYRR